MTNNSPKIFLLEGIHPAAEKSFVEAGFNNIESFSGSLSKEYLTKKLAGVQVIGIRSQTKITSEIIHAAPDLKVIGCFCIGTNQVDLDEALARSVVVFNAPYSNSRSVAELTIGAIIMMLRRVPEKNAVCHAGGWQKNSDYSFEVRRKKLGLIGYGNIGSQLSVLASGLGMHVYYYDIKKKLAHGNARRMETLQELLTVSDIVSLHVPARPDTVNLIGKEQLAMMKEGSYLINYSRGNVVDISALCDALDSGKILGAAVDVFPDEPKHPDQKFISPLQNYPQVLLTPHIGGSTEEAQADIGVDVGEKIIEFMQQGNTTGSVNFPEVSLPKSEGLRLAHIHQNKPGMLSKINQILSNCGINVVSQALQTKYELGYVLFEIEGDFSPVILADLRSIPGTISCEILPG